LALVIANVATGRLRVGVVAMEEALELLRGDRELGAHIVGYDPLVAANAFRGQLLAEMGQLEESARACSRAVELARGGDDRAALSIAHWASGLLAEAKGDAALALTHARRVVEGGESIGNGSILGLGYVILGRAHVLEEKWDDAIGAFEIARERGIESQQGFFLPGLALAWLEKGDAGRAGSTVEQAMSLTREPGNENCESRAQIALAQILLATEGAAARNRVEAALERAESLVRSTGAEAQIPSIHLARAELAGVLGDEATRKRELREAHRLYTEMGATGHAERVASDLAELEG
jgi:tetratricopeptide (TPR) repeat protein